MAKEEEGIEITRSKVDEISRKCKILETTNAKYAVDTDQSIKRQLAILNKLAKENESLRDEIKNSTRTMSLSKSVTFGNKLSKLNESENMLIRKIEIERRKSIELTKQLKKTQAKIKEIRKQRKHIGGVNVSKQYNDRVDKQVKVLENRLDNALIKYNEALSYNKRLREQIDNLRSERLVFDGIYKKMEHELHDKKRKMANIIEISNDALEERAADENELKHLKILAEKEMEAFDVKFFKLEQILESDREAKEVLKMKERERKEKEILGELTMEQEKSLKKQVIKGNWNLAEQKVKQSIVQEKTQSYEEAFEKIKKATGIDDFDELIETFIKHEETNFSLFNYVNELNNEIEQLEEQISTANGELDKYKGKDENDDGERKKLLKGLENQLADVESQTAEYEDKYNTALNTLNRLKPGIQDIFSKIGCSTQALSEVMGDEVTETNMIQYLGIIEQRTNELIQQYSASTSDGFVQPSVLGDGPRDPYGAVNFDIDELPGTGDDDFGESDSDEDERPLDVGELKKRAFKMIERREKRGANDKKSRRKKKT